MIEEKGEADLEALDSEEEGEEREVLAFKEEVLAVVEDTRDAGDSDIRGLMVRKGNMVLTAGMKDAREKSKVLSIKDLVEAEEIEDFQEEEVSQEDEALADGDINYYFDVHISLNIKITD